MESKCAQLKTGEQVEDEPNTIRVCSASSNLVDARVFIDVLVETHSFWSSLGSVAYQSLLHPELVKHTRTIFGSSPPTGEAMLHVVRALCVDVSTPSLLSRVEFVDRFTRPRNASKTES